MLETDVSLDPVGEPSAPVPTLGQQISRITQERGTFAKLNEQDLAADGSPSAETEPTGADTDGARAEADPEAENAPDDAMDVDGSPEPAAGFEELRTKLAAQVAAALNETALNLDFVSLLVSAARPQAGESSMSPMLKSQTPSGSLNAETVAVPAPAPSPTSGYGWKVRALAQSAESMASAASRLTSEAQKDARFWRDLLATTSAGEVVNRKLRVTYGYHDSGSVYFDRGTGTFVRDEESGRAVFKPTTALESRLLCVSVYNNGGQAAPNSTNEGETPELKPLLISQSVLSYADLLKTLPEPLLSVRSARNNLFEHELMYQLIQEARGNLAAHRVKLQDGGKIVCELFGGRIELELVDAGGDPDNPDSAGLDRNVGGTSLSNPAVAINYGLHILLTELYRAEFKKRHDPPAPINTASREAEDSKTAVLLPILARVHHSILVARTVRLVQVMLPDAEIQTKPAGADTAGLLKAPQSTITAQTQDTRITIEIDSPISNANEPMVVVSTDGKKTDIYDLTELELWLKWITRAQS